MLLWVPFILRSYCQNSFPLNEVNLSAIYKNAMEGDYRREVAPIINNKPVAVSVNLYIIDMVPTDKVDMHFSMDCFVRMQWNDHRLAFDPKNPDQYVPFDNAFAEQIWKPNIYFPFGKKGNVHNMLFDNVLVNLYGNGTVRYSIRISLLTFCAMNLTFYPFDIQDCAVTIECYAYSQHYVNLSWMDPPFERSGENLHIADYNKVTLEATTEVHYSGDFGQSFDTLKLHVKFDRDFGLYFLRDFFPCVMIVMLSWMAFWINHKAIPARVALGITTVLTIVTMTNSIRATAPKAKSFRSLDYYMLLCMFFVFGALGEFALVGMSYAKTKRYWLMEKRKKAETEMKNNNNADVNISNQPNKDTSVIYRSNKNNEDHAQKAIPNEPIEKTPKVRYFGQFVIFDGDQHIVDNVSKIFFPLFFLICNGVYFLFHRFHPDTVN